MTKFFETYKDDLIYVTMIIATVTVLYFLTKVVTKWLLRKEAERFETPPVRPLRLINITLNVLWLVLGVIALSFVFVDSTKDEVLVGYFKLASYLGTVTVITIILATISNFWFKHKIKEKITQDFDPTTYKFLRYLVVITICFIGLLFGLMAFPSLTGVAQTALGGAGVIALIAGVASQEALSNLVGGLFIVSFKPFKIGDVIKLSDAMVGTVTDITLRHTVIRNYENKMIVIPNAIINKEKLINYNLGELKCCEHIEIGISYRSDITLAKKILREECENHPLILDNRSELDKMDGMPMVRTALTKMNDSSLTIRAWAWASTYSNAFSLKCDILESTKKRFDANHIEIAFPSRTIYMAKEKNEAVTES